MTEYDYTKTPCDIGSLTQQIQLSSIAGSLDHMMLFGSALSIFFTADLSAGDKTTLDNLVSTHDGTPLSIDFNEMSANSNTSTNSNSYAVLNSMSSPYLLPGTYLVTFTGTFSTNVPLLSNPGLFISLFVNGAQVAASEQSQNNVNANAPFNMSVTAKVVVGLNQKIDLRWKNNGQGNTVTCTNRILDVQRL